VEHLHLRFLIACHESVVRRDPLLADLADSLGVRTEELFYFWAERRCKQRGVFRAGEWSYYFHGYECDLGHVDDGRFLRAEFGLHRNTESFTSWGVAQFVMTSKSPWPDFGDLKEFLGNGHSPYDEHSASLERAGPLCDHLERAGLIASADRELLALYERHTALNPDGIPTLHLPEGTPDRVYFDISVARRKVISEAGKRLITSRTDEALVRT
jgi:hypothetical protein